MAAKKGDDLMVGFRYEVNIIPEPQLSSLVANGASVISSAVSPTNSASFSEISGVSVTLETEDIKAGGDVAQSLPGDRTFSPLVLKRGLSAGKSELVNWVTASMLSEAIKENSFVTKSIVVKLLSDQGDPLAYWVFIGAYPTKWSISGLKAMSNELIIEEIELKYKLFYPVFLG